ncbi:MAG: aldehyde dehydrogenase (NADP(+)) [Proteobacteria bacterium]|nr:aldehyde dehydrogenase (NADP(+)) [Pseudomonadota bacterium]
MELHGHQIIGHTLSAEGPADRVAANPATGVTLPQRFHCATGAEIEKAVALADEACADLGATTPAARADFLDRIAEEIEGLREPLVQRCHAETGLPKDRVHGEIGRTTSQLGLFARLVREGSWVDARIDRADPTRTPVPKPDIRYMLMPLGPVVVFCASNFPLAFSVAGGDTASALAAGNPVIVKAHHAHPGTAALVAMAIQHASKETGMPSGTFSLLHGPGSVVGNALVTHPAVKAVGFTGSQEGGRALFDMAAARPTPIPVYAEMASINPVFVLPNALDEWGQQIAAGLRQSVNLGVGQFCTNPGIVVLQDGQSARSFIKHLAEIMADIAPAVMLHKGIFDAYQEGVGRLEEANDVTDLVQRVRGRSDTGGCAATPALFKAAAKTFLSNPDLKREVFGPSTLAVICSTTEEMHEVARSFQGELSSTLHGTETDLEDYQELAAIMKERVGRLVFNGFPTGVEVCYGMNHGGPYPATTDVHFTSVGAAAIFRFARPICYQNCPDASLPNALKNANPLNLWRMIDGERTREPA